MYATGPYNYSTRATYTAYRASWAPHYFPGSPLGDYAGATVLPRLPGTKHLTMRVPMILGTASGRKAISLPEAHEPTTMDPKELWTVPNIMLINVEASVAELEPADDFAEFAALPTPPPTGEKRKRSPSVESEADVAEMAAVRQDSSSESEDELPTKRRRIRPSAAAQRQPLVDDSEDDDIPTKKSCRHRSVGPSRAQQAQDELEMDETLARKLQYEENFGSRGRARVSGRAQRFCEL
ncbi:hypothetical protein LTR08_003438 [Meristemomyces frigidus]|nr:hypothetical protein LTR08_003438 [Meristemomyces frigidus]